MGVQNLILKYWKIIEAMDKKRLSSQSFPEKITVVSDIPYIEGAKTPNLLDIYYPEGTDKLLPVIFMVHGGGWLYGNKELNKIYAMNLALRGFAVVNINYHLVHESRFPKQIQDIFAALNWLESNGKNYFCDINNLFITGDSAGAHLSSLTMALQYNEKLSEMLGVKTSIKIKAGALICGVFDFNKNGWKSLIFKPYTGVMVGEKFKKSKYRDLMSFSGVYNGTLAPIYLMTSEQDIMKFQNVKMVKYCDEHNINYEFKLWPKSVKGANKLIHVFNVTFPLYEESIKTNDDFCNFFRKFIN